MGSKRTHPFFIEGPEIKREIVEVRLGNTATGNVVWFLVYNGVLSRVNSKRRRHSRPLESDDRPRATMKHSISTNIGANLRSNALALCIFLASLTSITALAPKAHAEKFAGEGFTLAVGARAQALGGAVIAGPFDGSASFWNPAGMNRLSGRNLSAMHAETFGSLLNHDFIGFVSVQSDTTKFLSSWGAYLYYLGGDGVNLTEFDTQTGRPIITDEASHGDLQFALSGATKFGPVDFGATLRLLYSDIVFITGYGISLDIGALYDAGDHLTFGLSVTDLTSGYIRYSDETSERINPSVRPGLQYQRNIGSITLRALTSGVIRFEGRKATAQYYQSDVSLDMHYGFEISYLEKLFGRVGADAGNLTLGAGFQAGAFAVDVAVLDHTAFDNTYRMSIGWDF